MTVGIDTNYNNLGLNNNVMGVQNPLNVNSLNTNSLFSFNGAGNSYDEDLLMPDSLKTSVFQTPTAQQSQNYSPNPVFQSNNGQNAQNPPTSQVSEVPETPESIEMTDSAISEKSVQDTHNKLMNRFDRSDCNTAQTVHGNTYEKTNAYKKSGAVLGLLAPIAGKLVQLFRGGKFSELFKIKQIAIACPVVGLAGLAVGTLVDSYVNSQRAKAADELKQG